MWTVYILRCSDNSLYTGITNDIERRTEEHNKSNVVGSKYVRSRRPATLVYTETVRSKNQALKRELTIKRLPKAKKDSLIQKRLSIATKPLNKQFFKEYSEHGEAGGN